MCSNTLSSSNSDSSHRGQGREPFPWWTITLLSFCSPVVVAAPRLRQASHSLAHPTPFATSATIVDFSSHLASTLSLSIFCISFFLSLAPTVSPFNIPYVNLVCIASSRSLHSFTRHIDDISSQNDSFTKELRPLALLPITRCRKLNFLSKTLLSIVGTSKTVIAAVLEKCLGHFRILFTISALKYSDFSSRFSVMIQFSEPYSKTGITHVSRTCRDDSGLRHWYYHVI